MYIKSTCQPLFCCRAERPKQSLVPLCFKYSGIITTSLVRMCSVWATYTQSQKLHKGLMATCPPDAATDFSDFFSLLFSVGFQCKQQRTVLIQTGLNFSPHWINFSHTPREQSTMRTKEKEGECQPARFKRLDQRSRLVCIKKSIDENAVLQWKAL